MVQAHDARHGPGAGSASSSTPALVDHLPSRTTGAFPVAAAFEEQAATRATSKRPGFLSSKAEALLKEAGAKNTWTNVPGLGLSGGQHQAGTCRMGNDPKISITNRYGQIHEIDNLFVADGSLHVTNGGFNPSLTIMALGFWIGGYIAREWKGTRFKSN